MNVGSKWEIYIPQNLAYGAREAGEIKPYSTLIFTVELVGIKVPEATKAEETKAADSKATPQAKKSAGKKKAPGKKK